MSLIMRAQREAILKKFIWDPDEAPTYRIFRKRAFKSFDGVLMLPWCGMWVGIEKDGYAHT